MDYQFVSGDDHLDMAYVPATLWQERVSARYREQAPRVVNTSQGPVWLYEGETQIPFGPRRGGLMEGAFQQAGVPEEPEPGVFRPSSPTYRLRDMDLDGADAHVIYGPLAVVPQPFKDLELKAECLRAYNSWLAEEFCSVSPERLIGLAILPVHDPAATLAEVQRVAKLGLRGAIFGVFECVQPVFAEAWDPVWTAAAEANLPISFHIGGGLRNAKLGETARGQVAAAGGVVCMQLDEALASILVCGALDRLPDLKIVLAEAGLGWVPYLVNRMDRQFEKYLHKTVHLAAKPSELFHQHVYVSFEDEEEGGLRRIPEIGADQVVWASDYPHPDSTWPQSRAYVDQHFGFLGEAIKRKITCDNAVRLYNLA